MAAILTTRGLTKSFGGMHAVDDISLSIEEGAVVGVVGTNGSGKTTFINLVTGYLTPTAGKIHLFFHSRLPPRKRDLARDRHACREDRLAGRDEQRFTIRSAERQICNDIFGDGNPTDE